MSKSITPVISVILLILITIIASASAYFFISTEVSDLESQGSLETFPAGDSSLLSLVSISGSKAIVRNDGNSPVTEMVVFINGEMFNYVLDEPLLPGGYKEINYAAQRVGEDLELKIIYNRGKSVTDESLAKYNTVAAGFVTDITPVVVSASIAQNATHLKGYCQASVYNVSIVSIYYYQWLLNSAVYSSGNISGNHDNENYLLNTIVSAEGTWKFKCLISNTTYNSSWVESSETIVGEEEPAQFHEGDTNASYCLLNNSGNVWFYGNVSGNTGIYFGNSSFNNDSAGSDPSGWTISDAGGVIQVVDEIASHKKVVELSTTASGTVSMTNPIHTMGVPYDTDVWVYPTQINKRLDIEIMTFDGMSFAEYAYIIFDTDGNIKESIGAGTTTLQSYLPNRWYNVHYIFVGMTYFNISINDVNYGLFSKNNNFAFWEVAIRTGTQTNSTFYVDAIDYAYADSGFYYGRNKDQESPGSCCGDDAFGEFGNGTNACINTSYYSITQGVISLANANATFNGITAADFSGYSVSSGDFNGDGFDDALIGAWAANPNGASDAGQAYIVYGRSSLSGVVNLTDINVTFNGITAADHAGGSVSSGDFNGDGFDDVLISASNAHANGASNSGQTYIVYGRSGLSGVVNLTDANVTFNGIAAGDYAGESAFSGDFNGDGFDDALIGAWEASPNGASNAGQVYIVYGRSGLSGVVNLTDANATFNGISAGDTLGFMVRSGDFNGDGFDDALINSPEVASGAGQTYVVYGSRSGLSGVINMTNANVTLDGITANDYSGSGLNTGNLNGDAYDDILIGAYGPNSGAGQTYVVYGRSSLSGVINLANANVTFNGINADDDSGIAVFSGNFNGDNFDDIFIIADYAEPNGVSVAGQSYIVFGNSGLAGTFDLSDANITFNGVSINGMAGSMSYKGDFNGDGLDDALIGAHNASPNGVTQAGQTYIVYIAKFD